MTDHARPKSADAEAMLALAEWYEAAADIEMSDSMENRYRVTAATLRYAATQPSPHSGEVNVSPSREAICSAAEEANKRFGGWLPQAWLEHFMNAIGAK